MLMNTRENPKRVLLLFAVCGAVVVAATAYATQSRATPAKSTAFGAASVAVRDAWATTLRCQYAHGASKRPVGHGGSFEVVGLTAEIREACRSAEDKAEEAMASPEYAAELRAVGLLMRDVYACVERRGFRLGKDDSGGHTAADPARRAAFASCKRSTFASAAVSELVPLP